MSLAQKSSIRFRKYDMIIWAEIGNCLQDGISLSQRVSHTCTLLYIKAMEMKSFLLMSYPDEYRADDQQLSTDGTLVEIFFLSYRFYGFLLYFSLFLQTISLSHAGGEGRGEISLLSTLT